MTAAIRLAFEKLSSPPIQRSDRHENVRALLRRGILLLMGSHPLIIPRPLAAQPIFAAAQSELIWRTFTLLSGPGLFKPTRGFASQNIVAEHFEEV